MHEHLAHGHPDHGPQPDSIRAAQLELRDRAREIVRAAEEVLEISARTTAALAHPALTSTALRHPGTGLPVQWALVRALTSRQGLGFAVKAPDGVMRRIGQAGEVFGQESLAALIAVSSLRLRIAATTLEHPELLADPGMRRLTEAVVADRDLASLRALRALVKDRGVSRRSPRSPRSCPNSSRSGPCWTRTRATTRPAGRWPPAGIWPPTRSRASTSGTSRRWTSARARPTRSSSRRWRSRRSPSRAP
ncbi:hypothetical protein ACFQ0T_04785 [Kitasatospora gansuensis]